MRTMFSDSHPNVGKANHQLMGYGELVPTFAKKYGDTTWYEAPKHAIKHEFCTRPEDFRHGCCIIFHDINVAFGWDDLSVPSCPKQNFLTYDVVSWGKKKVSQIRNRQQSRWTDYEDDEDDDDDIYIYIIYVIPNIISITIIIIIISSRWCLYLFRLPAPVMMTSVMAGTSVETCSKVPKRWAASSSKFAAENHCEWLLKRYWSNFVGDVQMPCSITGEKLRGNSSDTGVNWYLL